MKELITRTLTALLFVAIVIGAVILSAEAVGVLFFFVTMASIHEFTKAMKEADGPSPNVFLSMMIGLGSFILFSGTFLGFYPPVFLYLFLCLIPLPFLGELPRKTSTPFQNAGITMAAPLYFGVSYSLTVLIRGYGDIGPSLMIGIFALIWVNDTGAYLTGRLLGKHKLWPRISPGKTWEGSIGGTIFSLIAGFVMTEWYGDLWFWGITALIIVVFGTLGDLTISLLKRSLDIKDTGNILPGHGGILDRFDALLMALPFLSAFLMIYMQFL